MDHWEPGINPTTRELVELRALKDRYHNCTYWKILTFPTSRTTIEKTITTQDPERARRLFERQTGGTAPRHIPTPHQVTDDKRRR